MSENRSNLYVVRFNRFECEVAAEVRRVRHEHLVWFESYHVAYEVAAPDGWLEGDPASYAVYFTGGDDTRIAVYSLAFEDGTGRSVKPDVYQMYLHQYNIELHDYREIDH